jgi:hypothetical protein
MKKVVVALACLPAIAAAQSRHGGHDAGGPEHAAVASETVLQSIAVVGTPSSCRVASFSGALPRRTSPLTLAPRSSRAFAMRLPRLPVAPATTTVVESFMVQILGPDFLLRASSTAWRRAGAPHWRSARSLRRSRHFSSIRSRAV